MTSALTAYRFDFQTLLEKASYLFVNQGRLPDPLDTHTGLLSTTFLINTELTVCRFQMDSWEMTGSLIFIFLLLTLYEIATFQEMRVKKDSTVIKSNITQDQG